MTTDYLGNDKHDNLIGCTILEAQGLLGVLESIRVAMKDGRPVMGTMDYDPNRINVVVESDKIIAIEGVG